MRTIIAHLSLVFDSSVCLFFLLAIWLSFRLGSFYLHKPRLLPWLTTAKCLWNRDNCLYFILILILTYVYPPSSHKEIADHFVRWSGPWIWKSSSDAVCPKANLGLLGIWGLISFTGLGLITWIFLKQQNGFIQGRYILYNINSHQPIKFDVFLFTINNEKLQM